MILEAAAPSLSATRRPKRGTVCHVVHSLGVGGAEVLVDDMVRSLSDRFHCVVACLDQIGTLGRSLEADGFGLQLLNRQPGLDWKCARRLSAWIREQNVDIVHAHQCTPMFQAMLARFPGRRLPLVLTEHGRHHPDLPSRKRALAHRLLLGSRDRLVAVGAATRMALINNEGLPADRVEVIYNGVDLSSFNDASAATRDAVREELGLAPTDFVMILVARLDPIKDHTTALETLKKVRQSIPEARLLIVGEGPERAKIEALISAERLHGSVTMLGTRRDVPRLLAASDAFLLTSIGEGIPLTIIEAMAARVPVVATNVGGIPEMITHGESGFLHEPGDAAGLATSIANLHDRPNLVDRVTTLARTRAFSLFSRQQMLDSYTRIYEELLS